MKKNKALVSYVCFTGGTQFAPNVTPHCYTYTWNLELFFCGWPVKTYLLYYTVILSCQVESLFLALQPTDALQAVSGRR